MRRYAIVLLLFAATLSNAQVIQKWTDEQGRIHYGDTPPSNVTTPVEQLEVPDTFNPAEYDKAIQRYEELQQQVSQIEEREKQRRKDAEHRLDRYLDYLDEKQARQAKETEKKRKMRDKRRNATSIKLKRTKQSPAGSKKNK